MIPDVELRQLHDALPYMSADESAEALEILRTELGPFYRGFRSNRIIDIVRPPLVELHGKMVPGITEKQSASLSLDCLELLYGGSVAGGKMLPLSTLIPTPGGFVPLSEIHVGSTVFGRDGRQIKVLGESEVKTERGWQFTFDDGSTVVSSDDHRWLTFDVRELGQLTRLDPEWRAARRTRRKSRAAGNKSAKFTASLTARNKTINRPPTIDRPSGTVRTTNEIVNSLRNYRGIVNHAIPVAAPLSIDETKLPLDPYLLGCWLGDGTTLGGSITTKDLQIVEAFQNAGFVIGNIQTKKNTKARSVGFYRLRTVLKEIGVFGNKHIPANYVFASEPQRVAILQGLMDTDGCCNKRGQASFTSTKRELAAGAAILIRSLGMKAAIRERRAKISGRDCGPVWSIKFKPNRQVFRLPRKANRIIDSSHRTSKFRYIRSAHVVEAVPMKCLKVDAADGLFLVTENLVPTHNSEFLLLAALQYIDVPGYSAIILRETKKELAGAGGLLARAKEWFAPFRVSGECKWSGEDDSFFFQTSGRPSRLTFGYCATDSDKYNYKSLEYQCICWDELTEQLESCYLYLFLRLRKAFGLEQVPLRVRAASNPGGTYGEYVKARFIPDEYLRADKATRFGRVWEKSSDCGECGGTGVFDNQPCVYCDGKAKITRHFVPASLDDNPFIDKASYRKSMIVLPKEIRDQYEAGDWDVIILGNLYHYEWVNDHRYVINGTAFILRKPFNAPPGLRDVDTIAQAGECITFMTADTASTKKNWGHYSCLCVWTLLLRTFDLCLRYGQLRRVEIPELMPWLISWYAGEWDATGHPSSHSTFCMVEEKSSGIGLVQEGRTLQSEGITIIPYKPGTEDKRSRWQESIMRWENGQVWIPGDNPGWLQPLIRQLLAVDGVDMDKPDDFVDAATQACHYVTHQHTIKRDAAGSVPSEIVAGLPYRPNLREGHGLRPSFRGFRGV